MTTQQHRQDLAVTLDVRNPENFEDIAQDFDTIVITQNGNKGQSHPEHDEVGKTLEILMHDLKNPLSIVIGCASLLKQQRDLPEDHREEALNSIIESVTDMRKLISNWLNVSRLEDSHSLDLANVAFFDFVKNCVDSFEALAATKNLTLEFKNQGEDTNIECDHDRMIQAINNLISNAIKYTPSGGTITVTAYAKSSHVMLCVADTGMGISEEALPYIFDRFYRADDATKSNLDGTGLGLAITKAIINRHDGQINVSSQIGHGTKFTVMLPLVKSK